MCVVLTFPPLTKEDFDRPDHELGAYWLELVFAAEVEERGLAMDSISDAFVSSFLTLIQNIDVNHARHAALAISLRSAAAGDYSAAGRILKEHVKSDAENIKIANRLIEEIEKGQERRRAGGLTTASIRREKKASRDRQILYAADVLMKTGREPHELASILAKKLGYTADHIRTVLRRKKTDRR